MNYSPSPAEKNATDPLCVLSSAAPHMSPEGMAGGGEIEPQGESRPNVPAWRASMELELFLFGHTLTWT
jgi:hypothetical protein